MLLLNSQAFRDFFKHLTEEDQVVVSGFPLKIQKVMGLRNGHVIHI